MKRISFLWLAAYVMMLSWLACSPSAPSLTCKDDATCGQGQICQSGTWTDGKSCKYLGQMYTWGFAIR